MPARFLVRTFSVNGLLCLALQRVWASESGVESSDRPQDPIVVSASRIEQRAFDAPAAVALIDAETLGNAGPRVNLSEALSRVPGISVLNRQNYAQDLQLSIRGFGARSTFGIRGVRLIVDGIPATMPDGQGQASTIDLSSAKRIEVLRGPLALLYGNAAGGVVLVESEVGAAQPTVGVTESWGAWETQKVDVRLAAGEGEQQVLLNASHFETDGYRQHSAAKRNQLNARWRWQIDGPTRLDVTLNALDQPDSQDPQGLTRAQWQADPRQAIAVALTQDTRKTVRQQQLGAVLAHKLDGATTLSIRAYVGARSLDNALATPLSAQQAPTAGGGMVVFQRDYQGLGLQLNHRQTLGDGWLARWTVGVDVDHMTEDRQGYLNLVGRRGALKRDEDNRVENRDAFVQAALDIGPAWTATAGVRSSRVRFESADHYVRPGNPDDSGALSYRARNPVLGLSWHVATTLNLYANVGKGFETPTFTELAYQNGASGLNTDLKASRSRHGEIGAKWRSADRVQQLGLAVFGIQTEDEIVADSNDGGRTTYKNAPKTRRHGVELSWQGCLSEDWRAYASFATLSARFATPFSSGSPAITLPAGKRLPGVPDKTAFIELSYAPKAAWGGFEVAMVLSHQGRIQVNDANDDSAQAATLLNLRAGFAQTVGAWEWRERLWLNNATDRRYAGSVIVNDANRRYFEPALPRNAMVMVSANYRFR